jgi:PPM family protein phosphatase
MKCRRLKTAQVKTKRIDGNQVIATKAMTKQLQISMAAYGLTDVGQRRPTNEDALLLSDFMNENFGAAKMNLTQLGEQGALLAVADGMGGAKAGEVASAMAVSLLRRGLQHNTALQVGGEQLRQAVEYVNACIWRHAQENPQLKGMGTTLTAALVHDGIAYLAQVGDSRAYLIRGKAIKQLTHDQSLVQKLIDDGLLSAAEAERHPYRNVILQALGVRPEVKVAITTVTLEQHDCLLLCSDGLSNKISTLEIQQIVQEAESPTYACHLLTELANKRGGEDNITVIVAQFAGDGLYVGREAAPLSLSNRRATAVSGFATASRI